MNMDATKYKQIVDNCVMYLAATRHDLMYVLNLISSLMNCPTKSHIQAVKRVLK